MSYDVVHVPGRICLFGDKVDLMGRPVIAAAVSTTLRLEFKKRDDDVVVLESKNTGERHALKVGDPANYECDLKYWFALLKRVEPHVTSGFEAILDSDIPIGAGLSSSAAISVAFARALNHLFELGWDGGTVAEMAYLAEHDDLGIQCGRMDQYAIAWGGVTYIETGEQPRVTPLKVPPMPLVVGDSQEERRAETILNRVKRNILDGDPETLEAFDQIYEVVLKGRRALERGDFEEVGALMNHQQKQEGVLKADTPKLNLLCRRAIEAGAYGAKQMGAGGGGCMVAVCPPEKQADVAKAIERAGGKPWTFDVFFYD
ncbi:MAG: mevalonate kinase [Promethearchaeota archaeon]